MRITLPNRIGVNIQTGRTPGGFYPLITDVEVESYSDWKQPRFNWRYSDEHRATVEAANRVLEGRKQISMP